MSLTVSLITDQGETFDFKNLTPTQRAEEIGAARNLVFVGPKGGLLVIPLSKNVLSIALGEEDGK